MSNRSGRRKGESKTIKRSTLVVGVIIVLAFSVLLGITAGAMGVGSFYPQLNAIAQPIVCSGRRMSHSQQVSEIGTATYYSAKWYCVDERTGERSEVSGNSVALIAGPIYGMVIFAFLMTIVYLYWYSSVGPAKNGGPDLW